MYRNYPLWCRVWRAILFVFLLATTASITSAKQDPQAFPLEYQPRLVEAGGDGHAHTNRLITETSPYLLQHAHNPVDWYPWGQEAFDAALEQDKPILLSIGYATCYWCHVMERESFEDEEVAAYINDHFIPIKVDREQRPDVDRLYMTATNVMSKRGGWPLNMFLEPVERKPFFGGTYFPKNTTRQREGFLSVLAKRSSEWKDQRESVTARANNIAQLVAQQFESSSDNVRLNQGRIDETINSLIATHDDKFGGFTKRSPKFPLPSNLLLLMEAGWDRPDVRSAVEFTLDRMAMGGMYDQVAGGFHRYSTDRQWRVPHFEKMLYDNAQLAVIYARAYELTDKEFYAEMTREILDYVLREMTDSDGRFFSAQDAEAAHREGSTHVWTRQQIKDTLTSAGLNEDFDLAVAAYGLDQPAFFVDPHHPNDEPTYVLNLTATPSALATSLNISPNEFNQRLARLNNALLSARYQRVQPITDDKTLTAWNGLMIEAFANGARALRSKKYLDAAEANLDFLTKNMRKEDGGLWRTYHNGSIQIDGFLEDYAYLIQGLLALWEVKKESKYLSMAKELADSAKQRFWDEANGGYYDTLPDQADLFVRSRVFRDGAVPSPNAVMANNLTTLADITSEAAYLEDALATIDMLSAPAMRQLRSHPLTSLALYEIHQAQGAGLAPNAVARVRQELPVTVTVSEKSVSLSKSKPVTLDIAIKISADIHLNSNEPGDPSLVPTSIRVVGSKGVEISVEYPQGDLYRGEVRIYKGTITLPVTIRQTGPITGTPKLMLMYQPCTDQLCLPSVGLMLPLLIR
ncbi:MAG: DUF255 domain-containing protein [Phycisphaerales bacterium]|nr:DUF255 domain-containing protein [Phycisphaerales bacterium]